MKKESKYIKYLEWTLLVALFMGIIFISTQFGFVESLKPETDNEKIITFAGIFIMTFTALAAHELGHLIAGLRNGFRFELFVVGPFGIKREDDKVKLFLNKNLGYYGGVAGTSPVNDNKDNAIKFAKVLLAGPIASVFFGILCLGVAFVAVKPLGLIFYVGGMMSLAIFFATTIPSRSGMFFTDRKRYQRLIRPGKDQRVELALLNIMGKFSKDKSYRNIDENDINILVSDNLPLFQFYGLFNLVCFQLEHNGSVAEETSKAYKTISDKMSKNIVITFDKEIEKMKQRLNTESI